MNFLDKLPNIRKYASDPKMKVEADKEGKIQELIAEVRRREKVAENSQDLEDFLAYVVFCNRLKEAQGVREPRRK